MSNIMEDITEHDIYLILLNMLLNKEGRGFNGICSGCESTPMHLSDNVNQTTINNKSK